MTDEARAKKKAIPAQQKRLSSILIDDDLHKRIKVYCALNSIKIKQLIRQSVEEYIA